MDELQGRSRLNRHVQTTYHFFMDGIEDPFIIVTMIPAFNPYLSMPALPLEHYLRLQNMKWFDSGL